MGGGNEIGGGLSVAVSEYGRDGGLVSCKDWRGAATDAAVSLELNVVDEDWSLSREIASESTNLEVV